LIAARAASPWLLGAADGSAAVVVVFAAVWQKRYRRMAQRHDGLTSSRTATTALLRPVGHGLVEVFDYLVDTVQRRAGPSGRVPERVVDAALSHASPQDADSIAQTARVQGRFQTAERAYRQAYRARAASPGIGPGHPDTLATRTSIALVLGDLGQIADAEAEMDAVLGTMTQVLGPDQPDTLTSHATSRASCATGDRWPKPRPRSVPSSTSGTGCWALAIPTPSHSPTPCATCETDRSPSEARNALA